MVESEKRGENCKHPKHKGTSQKCIHNRYNKDTKYDEKESSKYEFFSNIHDSIDFLTSGNCLVVLDTEDSIGIDREKIISSSATTCEKIAYRETIPTIITIPGIEISICLYSS
jgi:hypothetical protein